MTTLLLHHQTHASTPTSTLDTILANPPRETSGNLCFKDWTSIPGYERRGPIWSRLQSCRAIVYEIATQMLKRPKLRAAISEICGVNLQCLDPFTRSKAPKKQKLPSDVKAVIDTMEKYLLELYVDAWLFSHIPQSKHVLAISPNSSIAALAPLKGKMSNEQFNKLDMDGLRELALKWHIEQKLGAHQFVDMVWVANETARTSMNMPVEHMADWVRLLIERNPRRYMTGLLNTDSLVFIEISEALKRFKERLIDLHEAKPVVATEAI